MTMTTELSPCERNPFPVYTWSGKIVGWRWIDETGQHSEKLYPTMTDALLATMRHIQIHDPRPVPWWKRTLRGVAQYLESVAR